MLNELLNRIKRSDRSTKIAAGFFIIATALALMMDSRSHSSKEKNDRTDESASVEADLDTFIPSGFSLVPIEVINSSGLDSILGRFGMVDLFLENQKNAIIKNVRLIRGVKSDGTWAVLVPSDFVQELLSAGGRYLVSVRHRNNENAKIITKPKMRTGRISYEN